jgi:hypothetical protein
VDGGCSKSSINKHPKSRCYRVGLQIVLPGTLVSPDFERELMMEEGRGKKEDGSCAVREQPSPYEHQGFSIGVRRLYPVREKA